ncbi:hypothetical protein DO97_09540 [Neosynechococcus sphagnicola sy1]|uniref:DUF3134 domain-containing protein n=1 Tax=Neosynechococcus sphagnicola sy1 TaxID=1497020 RepID=A0A098TNB3_9CYAN|nr:DUF3134 domain-containing protein [Neosynechococcus sphagnicola]KGF72333.1 hypothetical protein DO97_09540 [Neosynechococcus sphagnicola sy1]
MVYNPSLREEPREQRAAVIPLKPGASILNWLESSGRLLARDGHDFDYPADGEEISELMGGDDNTYEVDDDDDEVLDLED